MPIRPYLPDGDFSPEQIEIMGRALEMAERVTGKLDDPIRQSVAALIIRAARDGATDPAMLCAAGLSYFAELPGGQDNKAS